MINTRMLLAAGLVGFAGLCLAPRAAHAGYDERYAPRPPVVLSPNLTEPWIMQLRPRYREGVMTITPRTVMAPAVLREDRPAYGRATVIEPWNAPAPAAPTVVNPQSDGRVQRQAAIDPAASRRQRETDPRFLPQEIDYTGPHKAGTIVIDTEKRFLFLVEEGGKARRYGVGVGRPGFEWAGEHRVTRKAEWPDWTPPAAMLKRQPHLPHHMDGGPNNPLGARALYLGSTEYRIHGSNEPWTIGQAVSSGCIRMRNEDVTDLYDRVKVGTRVIVM